MHQLREHPRADAEDGGALVVGQENLGRRIAGGQRGDRRTLGRRCRLRASGLAEDRSFCRWACLL